MVNSGPQGEQFMADSMIKVRDHYNAIGLTDRIKEALATIAPETQILTIAQLAPLDQFHTRGILATAELADAAGLDPSVRTLDIGSGLGGPARYLAATFGCKVTGVDLSPAFIDAATYLTGRSGLSDRVSFQVGDAQNLPFDDASFDVVFLQHVAMNIEDRTALYAGIRRILALGGRLAIYDLVRRNGNGDVVYPVPWARDPSTSFLLTEGDTRAALDEAAYKIVFWRDDTQVALNWFQTFIGVRPDSGPNLGLVMGPDFRAMTGNLAQNLSEKRLGVLSAVLTRG
jgi:SAM-dependent methyltransferase